MSYAVGPVTTSDNYDNTTTTETQECSRLTVMISNAPIYYRLRIPGDNQWDSEHYLPSAKGQTFFFSFDRKFEGVQFRSAIGGSPAVVVAQLIPASDLPDNA